MLAIVRTGLALALIVLLSPRAAFACATAPPVDAAVSVVGEDAIIIWDPAKQEQQFIRRATFRSAASDFGFLVPTPTLPQLSEADDALFERLRKHIDPGEVTRNEYSVAWTLCGSFMLGAADKSAGAPAVEVLAETRVAGFDVASLKATDADALSTWLQDHSYDFRPALRGWLTVYVEQGWIINAFKIAREGERSVVGSKAVRMTFTAEQPFFPYREPEDTPANYGRQLRVFLLTPDRHDANPVGEETPARLEHAAPIPGDLDRDGLDGVDAGWWLQVFLDESAKRPPGGELTFAPKAGTEVHLAPRVIEHEVVVPIFLDVFAFVALVLYLFLRFRRRGGDAAPA